MLKPIGKSEGLNLHVPIFLKMLFAIFLVSLIPLGGLSFSTYQLSQTVKDNVRLSLETSSAELAAQVNNWTDLNLRVLRQAALHPDIISMDSNKQWPFLVSIENAYEWTYRVLSLDLKGYAVSRSSGQPIFDDDGKQIFYRGDRNYFSDIVQGAPYAQQVLISRSTGRPALCLSVPIHTNAGNDLTGVLLECSFLEVLSNAITDLRIGETGFAMLLNETGQLVAHGGNPELVSEALQDYSAYPALAEPFNQTVTFDLAGQDVVAYSRKVGLDWTLIVQQSTHEAFEPLRLAQRNAVILLLASLLLMFLVAYFFTRRLVAPLENLKINADAISRGQLDEANTEMRRNDEIGSLARAIERLRISVKMMLAELSKQTKDKP